MKNFNEFLNESADLDFKVADLFASLTRNYESTRTFYTDLVQFAVDEERRDWGDIRQKAELEKVRTEEGKYKLVFKLDDRNYLLEISFMLSYIGKNEKDAPEPTVTDDLSRLNVILEDLEIKKIRITSHSLNYSTSNVSDSVKKVVDKFMIKMLATDYDTLGESLASLEH